MATCAQDDHITKAHLRKQVAFQRPKNARVQRGGKTAQRYQGQAAEKPRLFARGRERWKSNPATRKASACQDGKKGKSSNKRGFSSSKRFRAQRRKAWVAESVVENVENFGTAWKPMWKTLRRSGQGEPKSAFRHILVQPLSPGKRSIATI